jgi:hypothetical protein
MANVSDNKTQVEATKASQTYTGGKMDTFLNAYESYCNFRLFGGVTVQYVDDAMVIQKMGKYTDMIRDTVGKTFEEVYSHLPWLATHCFQGLSGILTAYLQVAVNTTLTRAVMDNGEVALVNYDGADAVADGIIESTRGAFIGNGLGLFRDPPYCASWFNQAPVPAKAGGESAQARNDPTPKRQKTVDPERNKTLGVLVFDPAAQGANESFLDRVPVKAKKRNGRNAERLCMKFLTRGYACTEATCKRPHVGNLNTLTDSNRAKFCEYVSKTPGLSFVPGKEPAGMS